MLPFTLPDNLQEDDLDSRQRFAVVAAAALIQVTNPDTLVEMVEQGPKRFMQVASDDTAFGAQDFTRKDYDFIFSILASHVEQHLMGPLRG